MPIEAEIEHVPLSKHRLLEFLERQTGSVTAKVASIDLDTRASTVTEMLERCAAQGLVEREENRRPRDYRITDRGRRLLESFRSGQAKYEPESAITLETNVASSARRKSRVLLLLERARRIADSEGSENEREHARESFTEQAKADFQTVCSLYRARHELRSLGFFDSKHAVKAQITELENAVKKHVSDQLQRLVSLEDVIRSESSAEILRAVLELREALHLPASVFGRRPKVEIDKE